MSVVARSGSQVAENERHDLESLVPAEAEAVLDVGCGPGQLGAALKRRGVKRVIGIELNPVAAERARTVLDDVLAVDVEREALPFDDASFDCIVYGDVLEHLVDPWTILREQRRYLRPDGIVLVSVPNIAYWRVVTDLLRGRWEYRSHGTLDATHLRFFTRSTLEVLLESAGYGVVHVETGVPRRSRSDLLVRLSRGRLEHLVVWRYVFVGRPA